MRGGGEVQFVLQQWHAEDVGEEEDGFFGFFVDAVAALRVGMVYLNCVFNVSRVIFLGQNHLDNRVPPLIFLNCPEGVPSCRTVGHALCFASTLVIPSSATLTSREKMVMFGMRGYRAQLQWQKMGRLKRRKRPRGPAG